MGYLVKRYEYDRSVQNRKWKNISLFGSFVSSVVEPEKSKNEKWTSRIGHCSDKRVGRIDIHGG